MERGKGSYDIGKVAKAMEDVFTVVDQAAKTRYEGRSLRAAYDIWVQLATVHAAYMMDEFGNVQTDMDCGGGNTMFWDDNLGDPHVLFDSSCGRIACWDCSIMDESDPDVPPTEPQPLDAEDEWVVFGHIANARLGYFADWRDAHTLYAAEQAECLSEPGHEAALCHVRIAHRSAPDFLATKTGE